MTAQAATPQPQAAPCTAGSAAGCRRRRCSWPRQLPGRARHHHRQRLGAAHRRQPGVSPSQGTWVITSYAVAEAITVPLTGWLASRSARCGCSSPPCSASASSPRCAACRHRSACCVVLPHPAGPCGGPMMPLSQTLLMQIFPKEKQRDGDGALGMTTLVAPIFGPDPRRHASATISAGPGSSASTCRSRSSARSAADRRAARARDADRARSASTTSACPAGPLGRRAAADARPGQGA